MNATGPIAPDAPPPMPPSKLRTLWVVIREGGDRHYVDREPDEGIEAWAKGQDVIVLEYTLTKVVKQRRARRITAPLKEPSK